MKVLLINPPDVLEEGGALFFKFYKAVKRARVLPSLGLASIAAVLREGGVDVSILDANALGMDASGIKGFIAGTMPDVVGVTGTTPTFRASFLTCSLAKEVSRDIRTVMGGPHVTILPSETASLPEIDFCVTGEGERAMLGLLKALMEGGGFEEVSGLAYRENGSVRVNRSEGWLKDLDSLPFPARDLLPLSRYYDGTARSRRAMSIMTARGCPFRCIFCEEKVRGGSYRARDVERVVDEMEEIVNAHGFREVIIYDDTFTLNRKRVAAICEEILRRNLRFHWNCRTRVDCVTPELLRLMKRAGCYKISYGVESVNEDVIRVLNKGTSREEVLNAFRWSREAEIKTMAYFMIGSPGEKRESILETLRFAEELDPDFAYYSITVPYPGTELCDLAVREGHMPPDFWERFVKSGGILPSSVPYFTSDEVSREFLDETLTRAYRSFYFRPSYIFNRLRELSSTDDLIWYARMAKSLI